MKTFNQHLILILGLTVCFSPSALAEPDNDQLPERPMEGFRRGGPDGQGGPRGPRGPRGDRGGRPGERGQGPGPHRGPKLDGQLMKRIHNAADQDKDGKLNPEERLEFERLVGNAKRRMHQEILARFDEDGDGKLSESEHAKARASGREKMNRLRKEALKRFDKNGDGELDDQERSEAREAVRQRMMDRAKKFDTNNDGTLDEEERSAARQAMAKERGFERKNPRRAPDPDANPRPGKPSTKAGEPDSETRREANPDRKARREQMRQRFDTNKDGRIDDSERQSMRETLRNQREENAE